MQVPDEVREAARAVFRTRAPGSTLLARTGADDGDEGTARSLCFTDSDLSVGVDVAPGEDGLLHLTVRLRPPLDVEVHVEHPDPALSLVARGSSPLQVAAVPGGLTRLTLVSTDEPVRRWHTAWTRF